MKKFKDKSIQFHLKSNSSDFIYNIILKPISSIIFLSYLIFFTGCQSSQVKMSDLKDQPSYWVFKTNVYSAKKNKNISGYTHVTYMNPQLLRMDIYDPLGLLNAGTLIYKKGNFEAIMPLERKYFFGQANADSMTKILKSPVEPALFVNIIFQTKPNGKDWLCTNDEKGFLRECHNRPANIDIVWKQNMTAKDGWVTVTHNEGEVDLKLRNSKLIEKLPDSKFQLQVPNSYSRFKVDETGIIKL